MQYNFTAKDTAALVRATIEWLKTFGINDFVNHAISITLTADKLVIVNELGNMMIWTVK
jgi:hypothetical protein